MMTAPRSSHVTEVSNCSAALHQLHKAQHKRSGDFVALFLGLDCIGVIDVQYIGGKKEMLECEE